VHSNLDGAGFAKINLFPSEWRQDGDAGRYISDMAPVIYSGDPFSFTYALNSGLEYIPRAVVSTAAAMTDGLRKMLSQKYGCPVIDFYSLNETGPIAYSCPADSSKMHVLPHDIFVEILDENNLPVSEGITGRIAVTGGRNPYIPLLRYITGDSAAVRYGRCACGSYSPALINFSGREQVVFSAAGGMPVNSIDIARIIRGWPVSQYQFIQRKDSSCLLRLRPVYTLNQTTISSIHSQIQDLFTGGIGLEIVQSSGISDDKEIPFIKEK
jgi:phenylacetate-CoA ligase